MPTRRTRSLAVKRSSTTSRPGRKKLASGSKRKSTVGSKIGKGGVVRKLAALRGARKIGSAIRARRSA